MEVPRLRVESELWPLAYTTATAMRDPSHVCDLHRSSRQCYILNPLIEARDRTCVLLDTVSFCCATRGTPISMTVKHKWEKQNQKLVLFFFLYLLFRAASMAYGSSQARGRIRAVAAGLHHSHSNIISELSLQSIPQLMAMQDP